jgi:hypothetical protein
MQALWCRRQDLNLHSLTGISTWTPHGWSHGIPDWRDTPHGLKPRGFSDRRNGLEHRLLPEGTARTFI